MFKQLISLATACGTLYSMYLLGNKDKRGWIVGLLNQLLWVTFIVAFGAWLLAPLSICLLFMYSRNLIKWKRDELSISYTVNEDKLRTLLSQSGMDEIHFLGKLQERGGIQP